jgi:hypothetical protein
MQKQPDSGHIRPKHVVKNVQINIQRNCEDRRTTYLYFNTQYDAQILHLLVI